MKTEASFIIHLNTTLNLCEKLKSVFFKNKKMTEIKINNTYYISIGSFMDNNDGIMHYWPDEVEGWDTFFCSEDPIIILWTLSYFEYESFDYDDILNKLHKLISNDAKTIRFLKKFCYENNLSYMFIDFVYGEYSAYGNKELPKIIYEGKLIDPEYFEFDNDVFIQKSYYDEFMKSLDQVSTFIIEFLTESFES
ncbi:hypothetical protein OAE07_03560 [Winogradskyella sp.]|nr:hypothetical protein [Winogradskyella sp.]MDC1505889.1 hypothetical protein [Winogradskyella sp.]